MKASQRASSTKAREAVHENAMTAAPDQIIKLALENIDWPAGAMVSGFWPYRTEINVMPLLETLAGKGMTICLPVVAQMAAPLEFRKWQPGDPTEAGKWDIPVPCAGSELVVPSIMLVPMLAFDRRGYRLGYGGGFYDRTLEQLRAGPGVTAIGVAYHGQEVGAVVRGVDDQVLDAILTELEYIVPGKA